MHEYQGCPCSASSSAAWRARSEVFQVTISQAWRQCAGCGELASPRPSRGIGTVVILRPRLSSSRCLASGRPDDRRYDSCDSHCHALLNAVTMTAAQFADRRVARLLKLPRSQRVLQKLRVIDQLGRCGLTIELIPFPAGGFGSVRPPAGELSGRSLGSGSSVPVTTPGLSRRSISAR